jgi:hypothetical protein
MTCCSRHSRAGFSTIPPSDTIMISLQVGAASQVGSRSYMASTALVSMARLITRPPSAAETVIAVAQDLDGTALIQQRRLPHLLLKPETAVFGCWALCSRFPRPLGLLGQDRHLVHRAAVGGVHRLQPSVARVLNLTENQRFHG